MNRAMIVVGFSVCLIGGAGMAGAAATLDASNRATVLIHESLGALSEMSKDGSITNADGLIDFRVLKALLPENLPGLKRVEVTGQKLGPLDMTIAFAKANYTNEHNANVEIKISDMNSIGGQIMLSAQANWTAIELDRETDTGYDKTLLIDGFKAREQYDYAEKIGSILVVVENRLFIEINSMAVEPVALRALTKHLDFKKMSALSRKSGKETVSNPAPVIKSAPVKKPVPVPTNR